MRHKFLRYLHSSKEANFDLEKHFQDRSLLYVGYEEEMIYEYDDETNEIKLVGANGFRLSDEKIPSEEITTIPEED